MIIQLIASILLALVVSAFCSLCEAALYSLSLSQVEMLNHRHPRQASILKEFKKHIDRPITAILTLNTIANTIGASMAGAAAVTVFGPDALLWFSLFFTLAILLFSEILPKTVGVTYARQVAPFIGLPLQGLITLLEPITRFCRLLTRLVPGSRDGQQVSAEELQTIARLSRQSGAIGPDQEQVIANILNLDTMVVRQVMTPRTVLFTQDQNRTIREAMRREEDWRIHSRVPVYDRDPNAITGIVLSRDVFIEAADHHLHMHLSQLKRPVHFVPEAAPLNRVFIDFFEKRQHLFVVVDEFGTVTGVISLEDIIEEIVGREIVDESDTTGDLRELARKTGLQKK